MTPKALRPVTPGEQRVLDTIANLSRKGYPPTIREISRALGLSSTNAVSEYLENLKVKGKVRWHKFASRTITIT